MFQHVNRIQQIVPYGHVNGGGRAYETTFMKLHRNLDAPMDDNEKLILGLHLNGELRVCRSYSGQLRSWSVN